MSEQPEIIVYNDAAFGSWIDREVTPQMVQGKLLWLTTQITTTRKSLAAAEDEALTAKHAYDDAYARALDAAVRTGATSNADAERTAARTSANARKAKERADLAVKHLKDELEDLYRSQMPATQSLNRIVLSAWNAEWGATGAGQA